MIGRRRRRVPRDVVVAAAVHMRAVAELMDVSRPREGGELEWGLAAMVVGDASRELADALADALGVRS